MPNDCWNHITITASKEQLNAIIDTEFKDAPEWAFKIKARGLGACVFNLWSRWEPDFKRLEGLIEKYRSCWIKNEWSEEGGEAGVWIGTMREGKKEIQEMQWTEMCLEEQQHRFRTDSVESHITDGPSPDEDDFESDNVN